MNADLRDLYQEVILDHQRSPRNFCVLDQADSTADGANPLCGDKITVYLKIVDGVVTDVSFQGEGCAICTSSASMMTAHVKGKTVDEISVLFGSFHDLLTGGPCDPSDLESLGKLKVFSGVKEFPIRVKCATLPWHTLRAAIDGGHPVTTE